MACAILTGEDFKTNPFPVPKRLSGNREEAILLPSRGGQHLDMNVGIDCWVDRNADFSTYDRLANTDS